MNIKASFAILLMAGLLGCEARKTDAFTFTGGDGSNFEQAIIISGASDELSGIQAEHVWLSKHYQGWKLSLQSSPSANGHIYDKMDIVAGDGVSHSVYFDTTSFFGK
jgi:hypothetical protein